MHTRDFFRISTTSGYFWHTADFAYCILHTTFWPNQYVLLVQYTISNTASVTAPAHAALTRSGRNGGQTATEHEAVRKLPIPLSTTAYMTKTSTQKKTNEERQAKKKELDQATLRGEALETSWSAVEREGPGSCTRSNFQAKSTLFSILPTATLNNKAESNFHNDLHL